MGAEGASPRGQRSFLSPRLGPALTGIGPALDRSRRGSSVAATASSSRGGLIAGSLSATAADELRWNLLMTALPLPGSVCLVTARFSPSPGHIPGVGVLHIAHDISGLGVTQRTEVGSNTPLDNDVSAAALVYSTGTYISAYWKSAAGQENEVTSAEVTWQAWRLA